MTTNTPLSGTVCYQQAGNAMINVPTNFEVPIFTPYGNLKGIAKCIKLGGLGWLRVTQGH